MNSIRYVRASVLAPIRRPTRRNAWRAAATCSIHDAHVDGFQGHVKAGEVLHFLSLGCHTECQDSRLGSTARLLHLCRLGLDGSVPDHSTFSKNGRGRFRESDALRRLFESVVQRCIAEGLSTPTGLQSTPA
jgi:hypothetical protein